MLKGSATKLQYENAPFAVKGENMRIISAVAEKCSRRGASLYVSRSTESFEEGRSGWEQPSVAFNNQPAP